MKLVALIVFVAAAASGSSLAGSTNSLVPVSGKVVVKRYPATVSGHEQGYVLELDRAVKFEGVLYNEVRLNTYNDPVLFKIHDSVSKHLVADCEFTTVSPWLHQTLVCAPYNVRVEP